MIYYTSDLHIGHSNIIKYCNRPWSNVDDMNKALIENINERCGPSDTLVVLGDIAMGKRDETVPLVSGIQCKVELIPGNHDYCHLMFFHKKESSKYSVYTQCMKVCLPIRHTSICGVPFTLCHFPYYDDGTLDHEGRDCSKWAAEDIGDPLLCGHVHDLWDTSFSTQGSLMINVGVDVRGYKPISEIEIYEIWKEKS